MQDEILHAYIFRRRPNLILITAIWKLYYDDINAIFRDIFGA